MELANEGYDMIEFYSYSAILPAHVEKLFMHAPTALSTGGTTPAMYVGNDLDNVIDAALARRARARRGRRWRPRGGPHDRPSRTRPR